MIRLLLIVGVLVIMASACKGVCDSLQFHYGTSFAADFDNRQWWDPAVSWRNKYELGEKQYGERFPGSATVFVFLTDAWHFFQMLEARLQDAAIATLLLLPAALTSRRKVWVLGAVFMVGLFCLRALGFHLTYTLL